MFKQLKSLKIQNQNLESFSDHDASINVEDIYLHGIDEYILKNSG